MSLDSDHPEALLRDLPLTRPGLLITATDTDVGKTVVTCALAWSLRRQLSAKHGSRTSQPRIGVSKALASGCESTREGLVSADAEAIAHFSDCRCPLSVINPVRYAAPLSPAVAAEQTDRMPDWSSVAASLIELDRQHDAMLIEGVGGILAPLDPRYGTTVLDLCRWLGYPVLVVSRAGLGTLNHTAMTVRLLREAGCPVAGIVVNGYRPDHRPETDPSVGAPSGAGSSAGEPGFTRFFSTRRWGAPGSEHSASESPQRTDHGATPQRHTPAGQSMPGGATPGGLTPAPSRTPPRLDQPSAGDDPSMASNLRWLERMNRTKVLAVLPQCEASQVQPHRAMIPQAILQAAQQCYWPDVLGSPAGAGSPPCPDESPAAGSSNEG